MSDSTSYFSYAAQYYKWSYEQPTLATPAMAAVYYYALYTWNSYGHPQQFRLSTQSAMASAGINSWRTYDKALHSLIDNGFIKVIQKSKNQHSASSVSLCLKNVSKCKALSKALAKENDNYQDNGSSEDAEPTESPYKNFATLVLQQMQSKYNYFASPKDYGHLKAIEKQLRQHQETRHLTTADLVDNWMHLMDNLDDFTRSNNFQIGYFRNNLNRIIQSAKASQTPKNATAWSKVLQEVK